MLVFIVKLFSPCLHNASFIYNFSNFRLNQRYISIYTSFKNHCQPFFHLNTNMNFDSFSHGQIQSKLWLCKELEPFLPEIASVAVLGSWYNVIALMLLTRQPDRYRQIIGIDLDENTKEIADKITDAWRFGVDSIVTNVISDANTYDLSPFNLVINCSPEHMNSNEWFENLDYGKLVCIQSSSVMTADDDVWMCVNPNESLDDLTQKYPLSKYLYSGTKEIRYDEGGYNRFMLIGIK